MEGNYLRIRFNSLLSLLLLTRWWTPFPWSGANWWYFSFKVLNNADNLRFCKSTFRGNQAEVTRINITFCIHRCVLSYPFICASKEAVKQFEIDFPYMPIPVL